MRTVGKDSLSSFLAGLLNVTWYGTALLLALAVCLLVLSPWVDPPRIEVEFAVPVAFSLDADTHPVAAASGLEHVHIDNARGSLRFSPRSRGYVARGALFLIALIGLALWVVGQLREVLRTLRDGRPFVVANASRIRRIGWAVIVADLGRTGFAYLGTSYAVTHFSAEGLRFYPQRSLDLLPLLCGLIILVIAEVFRIGTRLDEEHALTV